MRRFVHDFLKRAGPTIVLFCGGCVGLAAALAQSYPRVKGWGQIRFDQWWPIVTAPWFLFAAAIVIAAYVWALLWTGQADQNPSAVQYHFHNHNYAPLAELADPIVRAATASAAQPQPPAPVVIVGEAAFDQTPNSRMIFEMLKRGFAVARIPAAEMPEELAK